MKNNILISFIAGVVGAVVVLAFAGGLDRLPNSANLLSPDEFKTPAGGLDVSEAARSHEEAVIRAVEAANPAVVSILITQEVPVVERFFEEVPSPFEDFFGNTPFRLRVPQLRQNGTERREVGGGSGFLVSGDGLIITNRHVVAQTEADYTVFTNDGTKYEANVIGRDPVQDLAILKIEGSNFPHLELADSSTLRVGQTVIAIGNALSEFHNTVSTGIISGLARSITAGDGSGQAEQLEDILQTDAAINPGNSGGPLLDLTGRVVGVNVAVVLGSENIGFALPANLAKSIIESVEKTGNIVRPYIGIRYVAVTPLIAEENNLPVDYGVLILRGETAQELAVAPGSPADKAGLSENDIILEAEGRRLDEKTSFASIIREKQVGDTLRLKVLHDGTEREVTVTVGEFPQ